jgi:tryptophanyl-tRNA synthetase
MSYPILLTGDRPSGALHLGHYAGSLKNRVLLQQDYDAYIMIADGQALTDNFDSPHLVRQYVYEVARDYLAVGLDPGLCTLFIQSQISELTELCFYYMNMVTVARLGRNPTVKAEIIQKGFEESLPVGFFCYPISQAADITAFGTEKGKILVPVGQDQLPMIELTNELVRKFNRTYDTDCLQEAEALLSSSSRLIGIDGQHKASKSLNNAIFLKDDGPTVKEKVFAMYTDPAHICANDPGTVEGNVVFDYLSAFHPYPEEVESLKSQYRKGGLGDMKLKSLLYETLETLLAPIREKRASLRDEEITEILEKGTQKARVKARITLQRVLTAMHLDYGFTHRGLG